MIYRVVLRRRANSDLETVYASAALRAPEAARRWMERFRAHIATLCELPGRCGLAPENALFDAGVRQLLFGRKPNVYRVLYIVDGDAVHVLAIRRAQRRFLTLKQLRDVLRPDESE